MALERSFIWGGNAAKIMTELPFMPYHYVDDFAEGPAYGRSKIQKQYAQGLSPPAEAAVSPADRLNFHLIVFWARMMALQRSIQKSSEMRVCIL